MKLPGQLFKQFQEALVDAHVDTRALEKMLFLEMELSLNHISGSSVLPDAVFELIKHLTARDQLEELLVAARKGNPTNQKLKAFEATFQGWKKDTSKPSEITPTSAAPLATPQPKALLNTQLLELNRAWPQEVHFIEVGLSNAKAVGLVKPQMGLSTGFLTLGNLLIVPSFVIGSVEEAKQTVVQFGYEHRDGKLHQGETFKLKPEDGFFCSQDQKWAAIRIPAKATAHWGALPLVDTQCSVGEPLSRFHYGHGNPKQAEYLYLAVLEASPNEIVYGGYGDLKMPGSSGAPVFNRNWQVIAIHHSAGTGKDFPDHQYGLALIQFGTPVGQIVEGLKQAGLYVEP